MTLPHLADAEAIAYGIIASAGPTPFRRIEQAGEIRTGQLIAVGCDNVLVDVDAGLGLGAVDPQRAELTQTQVGSSRVAAA